jgi:hypothetical protein
MVYDFDPSAFFRELYPRRHTARKWALWSRHGRFSAIQTAKAARCDVDYISADQFEAAERRAKLLGLQVHSHKFEPAPYDIDAAAGASGTTDCCESRLHGQHRRQLRPAPTSLRPRTFSGLRLRSVAARDERGKRSGAVGRKASAGDVCLH